jgi:hypothetical protein
VIGRASSPVRNRPGAISLAELLMVAWLFAVVMTGAAGFAVHQGRLAAVQRDRVRFAEAVRAGAVILGGELRHLTGTDISLDSDSIRIRAFRGGGPVCESDSATVYVLYTGVRAPEPDKDSVLLLAVGGEWTVDLHASSRTDACGGALRFLLGASAPAVPRLALVFETGAYSLTAGAIRYRRGQGGRQPLTEALLRDMAFEPGPGGLKVRLAPDGDSLPNLRLSSEWFPAGSLNSRASP